MLGKPRWMVASLLVTTTLVLGVTGAFVAEQALHIPANRRAVPSENVADSLASATRSRWVPAQVKANDGSVLRGWLFRPAEPSGDAAILLHGVSDTRRGMLGMANLLLQHGYTVLLPDSRGHGGSDGNMITYGLLEADDVHRWADSLFSQPSTRRLYGMGASMGAAILLQALAREPRFSAVVTDCAFADFHQVAYDRLAERLGMQHSTARLLLWPAVEPALLYTRARYGLDLAQASPERAVRQTRVPVLLIHGAEDRRIPPEHSRLLRAANPRYAALWEVPHTGHTGAWGTQPQEFQRRVLAWFAGHR